MLIYTLRFFPTWLLQYATSFGSGLACVGHSQVEAVPMPPVLCALSKVTPGVLVSYVLILQSSPTNEMLVKSLLVTLFAVVSVT